MSKQCVLRVDKRLFPQEAIFKAAYHFVDRYYIYLSCSDEHTVAVSIEDKGHCDLTDIDKQFGNEQSVLRVQHFQRKSENPGRARPHSGRIKLEGEDFSGWGGSHRWTLVFSPE